MLLQRSNARLRISLPVSSFHNQSSLLSPRPNPSARRSIIQNPINPTNPTDPSSSSGPWIVKIISTLYAHSPAYRTHLNFLRNALTPSIAYHVIRRLNNPKLALGFFEFTRSSFEFNHPTETYNFLIVTLSRAGLKDSAKVVFHWMRQDGHSPDSCVVGLLVSSHTEAGNFDSAMELLFQAHECECRPNTAIYNNLLNLMVKNNRVNDAVGFLRGSYFGPDTFTFNIVIKGLCRFGDVDRAFKLFDEMGSSGCSPDVVTFNTLIDGLCRTGNVDRGHKLLDEIRLKRVCLPDVRTYTSIISGYCKMGKMEDASCLFDEMVAIRIRPSLITYNVLIDGYGKAGQMDASVSMYVKMLDSGCLPDVVTFTSLIDGYCRSRQVDDAMKLWHEMGGKNISPNGYTFSIIINALCKENRLKEARNMLTQLKRSNIIIRTFMYNSAVDGFCKVGNVDEANRIVAEMEGKGCIPDKFTFTILIIGHCMKGRMQEAIDLFNRMMTIGCAPDAVTVNALISCLLKAGMPHEANQIALNVSAKDFSMDLGSSREILSFKKIADIPVAV
eukprot:TRINITY_DN7315_c0_g1_i6.p1 TRINITY_DN7315_c0_g1~~TRINITY_DN7315_c0_g1_i6.p1  ORF type:complete len:557 (-),score=69.47 TRINITY_DN7315_c0_g1_i6:881-2551(-)